MTANTGWCPSCLCERESLPPPAEGSCAHCCNHLMKLESGICHEIGCSGQDPDMCRNNPQDCSIIRKVMESNDESNRLADTSHEKGDEA